MRLIDADSLKAKFKDPVTLAFVKEMIDAEPTVDAFTALDIREAFNDGYMTGLTRAEYGVD